MEESNITYTLEFDDQAIEDIKLLKKSDKQAYSKLSKLLDELTEHPTTGKQYFPSSGNQPGTAAEEATGGRTRPAQEKKPGVWNGYVILNM